MWLPSPPTAHSCPAPAARIALHGQFCRIGRLDRTFRVLGSIFAIRFGNP